MASLLFLGSHGSCRSQMAEGFARRKADAGVAVSSAGVGARPVDERAVRVMGELGIDISGQVSRSLGEIDTSKVDVVIAMDGKSAGSCASLPGAPVVVSWDLPDVLGNEQATLDDFRQVRDRIRAAMSEFFAGGYLPTILAQKRNSESVLDHLSDGVLAHDCERIITCFNRAAERITGYDRQEVIGRDCYEVFAGGLCGNKCNFRQGRREFDRLQYPLKISAKDGNERRVEMTVAAMRGHAGEFQGVLASFHDVTEVTQLRRSLKTVQSFHGIIGRDQKMQNVYELISDLAVSDCPVLILGESGTGKELVAGAIHGESQRAGGRLVTINCGALPEGILESELFGHVRGAFTGAIRDKKGRFELADGGTIFLDEVAELSGNMQVKLLRVLQEGTFERVGGEKRITVDVRVISATNKDLREMVKQNRFREDLFYRLCVVPVSLPPLRDRRNDIPLLVSHTVKRLAAETGRSIETMSPEAMHCLIDYRWPGNIRELQNAIQYAFVKCKGDTLELEHLPPEIIAEATDRPGLAERGGGTEDVPSEAIKLFERESGRGLGRKRLDMNVVKRALTEAKGNKVRAAKLLGVGRATLYRFLKDEGMV